MKENNVSVTKRNLMDAFWLLYCEKRIEKITVKEIAQKAGYNRSTFYEYFVDVYDVLEQIEEELIPDIDQLPPISVTNIEVGMPVDIFMNLYDKYSDYYFVLLGEKGDPAFAGKLKNSIKRILKEALGSNTEINHIELDFILEFTLSGMIGIMSYWFKQDKILSAEELINLIRELMEKGLVHKLNS